MRQPLSVSTAIAGFVAIPLLAAPAGPLKVTKAAAVEGAETVLQPKAARGR